jgi:hypothetical protein
LLLLKHTKPNGQPAGIEMSRSGFRKSGGYRWLLSSLYLVAVVTCSPGFSHAQEEYFPEHPDVEKMVRGAVSWLESMGGGAETGEKVLVALAIVEANKRYFQEIPRDHPRVRDAIDAVLRDIPDEDPTEETEIDRSNLLKHDEIYQPCLAMILLAEVDDSKYAPQIKRLLKSIQDRQESTGAFTYLRKPGTGDTSQTQYAALAMFVAKHHGFNIRPEVGKRALQWLTVTQRPGGGWVYTTRHRSATDPGTPSGGLTPTLSIQAAGLGTVYLLSDVLQLSKRRKNMGNVVSKDDIGLPKSVSVYVRPRDGEESMLNKVGPLVKFDGGRLNASMRGGNSWLEQQFTISPDRWTYYYLYALERYAWFREQAEGDLGKGVLVNWYDQGVEYLKGQQQASGGFKNEVYPTEKPFAATSFAVLFLVRSSEVLSQPSSDSELVGGVGFPKDAPLRMVRGEIVSSEAEKNLADMLDLMKEDLSNEELANLTRSLKKAVVEFKNKDNKSRGEIKSFLRGMVSARNYFRRLIAVRFLAGEQDMDNVPALLFALGDPDFRICLEAHDGLRLISRRIDSLRVSPTTRTNARRDPDVLTDEEKAALREEFRSTKKQWTDWFLKIRPDAELLD